MTDSERFNPQMLTLARSTRGWSQAQTSEASNVSRSLISKYESAATLPRDAHIEELAAALDYPVSFFFQDMEVNGPGVGAIFHRKQATTASQIVQRFHAIAETRRFDVVRLLKAWPIVDPVVPALEVDEFDDDPASIARMVRSYWNLPPGPIFNLTEAMERNGCIIYSPDFGTRKIDGFSLRLAGLPPLFHINSRLPPDRWRWTLAHELGHVVMHGFGDIGPGAAEDQAHRFAGEFLAPAAELKPTLWNLDFRRLAGLKREWKISMQSLIMRARQMETITAWQQKDLFIRLNKAGHKMREPASLDPPVEREKKARKLVHYHLTQLEFARDELLGFLRIGEYDFDRYYGTTGDKLVDTALAGGPQSMDMEIELEVGPDTPRLHLQLGCAEAEVAEYQESLDALYFRKNVGLLTESAYKEGVSAVMRRLGLKLQALRNNRTPVGPEGSLNLVFGSNAPPLHLQLGCHPEDVAGFQQELDEMYGRVGNATWQRNADEIRRQQIVAALERKVQAIQEHNQSLTRVWGN